jgi:hypothetical protein
MSAPPPGRLLTVLDPDKTQAVRKDVVRGGSHGPTVDRM